jgi:hypothetical protein
MKRMFEVDWDSLDSVERRIRNLRARAQELERGLLGKCGVVGKITGGKKFAACRNIWETDIGSVYASADLSTDPVFFVYAHLNPVEPVDVTKVKDAFAASLGLEYMPFYVGKGKNSRDIDLGRNETHRKVRQKLAALGEGPIVKRIAEGLTESEALQAESKLIDIFGLLPDGGLLCNLDEGYNRIPRRMKYRKSLSLLCSNTAQYERVAKELFN